MSDSIDLEPSNHLVWANRSATKAKLGDYDGALEDAQHDMCGRPSLFVERVNSSKLSKPTRALSSEHLQYRVKALEKEIWLGLHGLDIETDIGACHLDVALALAAGRDLQFASSSPSPSVVRATIIEHARHNPNWAPKTRYLLIPCAEENQGGTGLSPRNVEFDPAQGAISGPTYKLLGCQYVDSEMLYSEDGAEMMRGNRKAVGLGYIYTTYEFIMDDNCVAMRPLNELASRLLHRPKTYGPVLVLRATHLKTTHQLMQSDDAMPDTIAWEILPLQELQTEEWRVKRAEWKELLRRNRETEVGIRFGTSHASSRLEGLLSSIPGIQVVHV